MVCRSLSDTRQPLKSPLNTTYYPDNALPAWPAWPGMPAAEQYGTVEDRDSLDVLQQPGCGVGDKRC